MNNSNVKSDVRRANVLGRKNLALNTWGKASLLLELLYQQGLLPNCSIHWDEDEEEYVINATRVGATEEMVTTCIWLMVESFAAEGHIDFQDNQTVAEAQYESEEA